MAIVDLSVDPNGAAVVTYVVGTTLYQATRPAGTASAFGAPITLAANANGAESMASDAAGDGDRLRPYIAQGQPPRRR